MQQVITMADLIMRKHKVVHHGGCYCTINRKKFHAKHVKEARFLAKETRKELREEREAINKILDEK